MSPNCKLCGNGMTVEGKLGSRFTINWKCDKCNQYSIVCGRIDLGDEKTEVESETLRSGNFYIIFFPAYKSASIVSTQEVDKKILKSFDMDDFTAADAEHWNKKLKTYVLFQ